MLALLHGRVVWRERQHLSQRRVFHVAQQPELRVATAPIAAHARDVCERGKGHGGNPVELHRAERPAHIVSATSLRSNFKQHFKS